MLEHNTDPPFDDDQYLVLVQDEDEEEEEDDGVISYCSRDDGDWFFNEGEGSFPNEGDLLCDITKAISMWGPLKDEDWSIKLKTLFKEKDEKEGGAP